MFGLFDFRKRRRERLRSEPFPQAWEAIIRENIRLYDHLLESDRKTLQGHVQVFLAEKQFEGCGGLELTDEVRVTIAAQAGFLQLRRSADYFPRLVSILVYPSTYVAPDRRPIGGGSVLEGEEERLGEAWHDGVVVLAWDEVLAGCRDGRDGRNVVLHEFAHQLDQQDGAADGTPVLDSRNQYRTWARVFEEEYERLRRNAWLGRPGLLDEYGATDPAEFFAVATECFFERPSELRRRHPELYQELLGYYQLDTSNPGMVVSR